MERPYVIVSPNYDITSGGVKVMYGLYGWLLAKGVEVYMNCTPDDLLKNDLIGIYPEIQPGNPVQTDKIVRYVLNTPGIMRGYDRNGQMLDYPTDFTGEKPYYFSRMYGETDDDHYMFLPIIPLHIFKDLKVKRTKSCYLVGKGVNKQKHPEDAIALDRRLARDQSMLNNILNECTDFYCYDDLTAMLEVARLAGIPRTHYHGKYSIKELSNYEPGLNGITDELDPVAFRTHYIGMIDTFETQLDKFIVETQKW